MKMISSEVKQFVLASGADRCGIADADRFDGAPEGFSPKDIWHGCRSVIVFLRQMPAAIITASNVVPYSHTANLLYNEKTVFISYRKSLTQII